MEVELGQPETDPDPDTETEINKYVCKRKLKNLTATFTRNMIFLLFYYIINSFFLFFFGFCGN